jgi:hypothetical protein
MKTRTKARKLPENMVNNAPRIHATFEPGDVAHQGDLILICIRHLPHSARPRADRQLAEGSTQGSRHVLERGEVYDADPAEVCRLVKDATGCDVGAQYLGPVFISPENPSCDDLTHPEHGNHGFPAGTVCAVVYQRNLDSEQREQRVRD